MYRSSQDCKPIAFYISNTDRVCVGDKIKYLHVHVKGEYKVAFKEFLLYNFFERPHTVKLTFKVLLKTEQKLLNLHLDCFVAQQ